MPLEGIHHITAITGNAPRNVDFYARVLGLRLIKKTVNFDAPDVYHLYFGDEQARPGSILTFFEFPQAAPGRAGAGMVHRVLWRVGSEAALDFWAARLSEEGTDTDRDGPSLRFSDFEGLAHELIVDRSRDAQLAARAAGVPAEHALIGFEGARAYTAAPERSEPLLTSTLGFSRAGSNTYEAAGTERRACWIYDTAPSAPGVQGAGTVHHIAWHSQDADLERWRADVGAAGLRPTPVIDRQYFHSVYFREPSGVLFELATPSPGFATDEEPEHLGEALRLPPQHEHLRPRLERSLAPLPNPRGAT